MEERSERCSGNKRKGEENEQWITKTSVLPYLFSFLLDLLCLLFVLQVILFSPSLPASPASLLLLPSPRCHAVPLPLSSFFLFSLISICLHLSLSLSPAPPGVFRLLLILSVLRGTDLDMALHCLFPHTPNPLSLPQECQAAFRERPQGVSKCEGEV